MASLPERDRYLVAMSAAVLLSGLADRIGMAQSTQVVQTKMLDYFFSLRKLHTLAFQPIVDAGDRRAARVRVPLPPGDADAAAVDQPIVQAAINTDRGVELDIYIVATILERIGRLEATARDAGRPARRYAINLTPFSLLDAAFEATALAAQVRAAGLDPRQITIECTEQQSVTDIVPLQRQVKALRKLGFGFAVDDAGAGYASFALIAALRPTVIKIDRDIIHGIGHDTPSRRSSRRSSRSGARIGARLLAEGIERRADLATLTALGVDLGQGYPARQARAGADGPAPPWTARLGAPRRGRPRVVPDARPSARLGYHRGHDRPASPGVRHERPSPSDPRPHPGIPRRHPLRHHLHRRPRRRAPARPSSGTRSKGTRSSSTARSAGAGRPTCCVIRGSRSRSSTWTTGSAGSG